MKKIWNALIYGDRETKKCIGSVILFSVLAVILFIVSGVLGEFYILIVGMISAIVAIMISQTFTLVDDDFVAEVSKSGDKETVFSVSAKKNAIIYGNKASGQNGNKKSASVEPPQYHNQKIDDMSDRDAASDNLQTDGNKPQPDGDLGDIDRFAGYNQQVMKKVQKKYHVKKDHRPIIIDFSESYRIKQCPAFIWRAHNKVFLLLLEKEPRRICISRDLIHNIGYKPNVPARKEKEYVAFQKDNLVTKVFEDYLPDYHDSRLKDDSLKVKNLYTIYPDICLTNRSVFQVMDLLLLNFMPEDKITKSDKINGFFKRIYAANIMYKDKVYSIIEYKNVVDITLKEMCYAEVPKREFVVTLENLVKARLISQQYADHYIALRDKIRAKYE